MSIFSVSCIELLEDSKCIVAYKFRCNDNAITPTQSGTVTVTLSETFPDDREALAELSALYKLLVMKRLQGGTTGGRSMTIQVTQGAIKKALAKAALKADDKGKTEKGHVALFSQFLATQFFEANIEVIKANKWVDEESKAIHDFTHRADGPGHSKLNSVIGHLIISRHGLNRFIERLTGTDELRQGIAFENLPDHRWTKSWIALEEALARAKIIDDKILPKQRARLLLKYGDKTVALYDESSLCIFLCNDDARWGLTLATVLINNEFCTLLPKPKAFSPYR